MTRSRKRKLLRTPAKRAWMPLASALLAGAPMVHAQQADTGELAEVLVTAQKRTEDVQKVPISMQVLGGERLEQLQVGSFDDYAKFLPSVSFQSLGPGQAQLYFRGITSGVNGGSVLHAGSTSPTGVYLDETPITTIANSPDLHIYDVQRVEALAGPQGTLYGASSLSGTLRIITNKPDPTKFSAGYDVKADKYSAGNGGGEFEGYVNMPISDSAAIRLVGYYDHEGGYISNVPATRTYCRNQRPDINTPCPASLDPDLLTINNYTAPHDFAKSNFNDVDTFGGRAALKIDLNDRWTVTPMVIYQNQRTNGNFTFDPKIGDLQVTDFAPDFTQDHWYQTALTIEGKISNFDVVYTGGYFERHTEIASDYSEYSVGYDYYGSTRFRNNAGQLIDPTQSQLQTDRYTKMTHEVRISSPATDVVHFVTGLFYQRQTDTIRDEYLIPGLGDVPPYNFSVPGQAPNLYLTQQDRIDRDYAAFLDVTWNISDQWKLSGGIRGFVARNTLYGFFGFNSKPGFTDNNNGDSWSRSTGTGQCSQPQYIAPAVPNSNLPCINTDAGVREAGQTHRVNLTYQVDPTHMLYATYSTGFRPGGVNRRVGIGPYTSDTLTNYEIGWKTAWLDHTLRFNGAIFYEQWKDVQLGVNGLNGITDFLNIGNAESKGLESDVNWLLWEHLDLSLGGTYVNAKTTTPFCGENSTYTAVLTACADPAAPSGTRLPVTPEIKANLVARYKWNYAENKMFVQAAVLHQSSSNPELYANQEAATGTLPQFTTVDLSVGVAKNNWNLEIYMNNAFDSRGELNRQSMCADTVNYYCFKNYRVYPVQPQLVGIKFGNKF
jgi:iron complex outermembrane receptor protein